MFQELLVLVVLSGFITLACAGEEEPIVALTPSGTLPQAADHPAGIAPFLDQCLVRVAEPPLMPVADSDTQLMGIVVARGTADPVPGIRIVLAETGVDAMSDEHGHFKFHGLASDSEPDVRRSVFVDDSRFAQWEVRNLEVHLVNWTMLVIQVSETEPFYDEHRTPDEIDRLGVYGTSPLNFQPTPLWETFKEICDPWTGEPRP